MAQPPAPSAPTGSVPPREDASHPRYHAEHAHPGATFGSGSFGTREHLIGQTAIVSSGSSSNRMPLFADFGLHPPGRLSPGGHDERLPSLLARA